MRRDQPLAEDEVTVICMDGFDLIPRVQMDSKVFKLTVEELDVPSSVPPVMQRFVAE